MRRHLLYHGLAALAALPLLLPAPARAGSVWEAFATPVFEPMAGAWRLPHETATALAQDSRGAIWIGTVAGLARHDGHRTQSFTADGQDPAGLPDSTILALLGLPDGSVLVGTRTGGLVRFDPGTGHFLRIGGLSGPGGTGRVNALAPAAGGGAWIAADGGLGLWRPGWNAVEPVPAHDAGEPLSILEAPDGTLWVGGKLGLIRRAPGAVDFQRLAPQDRSTAELLGDEVRALHLDVTGRLWFGTGRSGAGWVRNGQAHALAPLSGRTGLAGSRSVRTLAEPRPGRLWVATEGAGILSVDTGSASMVPLQHDPALPVSLPADVVHALLRDRAGNIWVATERGVRRHDPMADLVLPVLPSPLSPLTLSDQNVYSVAMDSRGRAWLGLGRGRIDILDPMTRQVERLQLKGTQAARDVRSLLPRPDGSMLAGSSGVSRIDGETLAISASALPELDGELVLALAAEGDAVLAGTPQGLYRFDGTGRLREHVRQRSDVADSLPDDHVAGIFPLPGLGTWLPTEGGIGIRQAGQPGLRVLRHQPGVADSLPMNRVGALLGSPSGEVWAATFGGGVGRLASWPTLPGIRPRFQVIHAGHGLPGDNAVSLLNDTAGRIWTATARGLSVIDPGTGTARALTARDGLRVRTYLPRSAAQARSGELLFGGLGGLSIVLPWRADRMRPPPEIAFTGMAVQGTLRPPGQAPDPGGRLDLPEGARRFRLEFALRDYRATPGTRFAYRLENADAEWNMANPDDPAASYAQLPPGLHRLQVRAWESESESGPVAEASLTLSVPPRWHETAWFGVGLAILGVGGVAGLVQARTAWLRRRERMLSRLVEERTQELRAANRRLNRLAATDPLTGLLNRRRFAEWAEQLRLRAEADGRGFAVVLFDLDHFKAVNDTHGHNAGDAVLTGFARLASGLCRPRDLLGRHGGEELILLLPGCGPEDGARIAERIRAAQDASGIAWNGQRLHVTVSAGVTAWRSGDRLEDLVHRADQALYRAKEGGRNRVAVAMPEPIQPEDQPQP